MLKLFVLHWLLYSTEDAAALENLLIFFCFVLNPIFICKL
jgi:hypothetical protein